METATIDLIQQSGQYVWLTAPAFLGTVFISTIVVLSGLPGRAVLAFETRLALRHDERSQYVAASAES